MCWKRHLRTKRMTATRRQVSSRMRCRQPAKRRHNRFRHQQQSLVLVNARSVIHGMSRAGSSARDVVVRSDFHVFRVMNKFRSGTTSALSVAESSPNWLLRNWKNSPGSVSRLKSAVANIVLKMRYRLPAHWPQWKTGGSRSRSRGLRNLSLPRRRSGNGHRTRPVNILRRPGSIGMLLIMRLQFTSLSQFRKQCGRLRYLATCSNSKAITQSPKS